MLAQPRVGALSAFQAVAARVIQVLHEFSLRALFVRPNKERRLLRQHMRSTVLVHRRRR